MNMGSCAHESIKNLHKFLVGMNSLAVAMAWRRRTYGDGSSKKMLGEWTALRGARRCSGEPSLASRGRKGKNTAAAMVPVEFVEWRMRGRRRGNL